MSDGSLSQDEIDALLQGADELSSDTLMNQSGVSATGTPPTGLNQNEKHTLTEILNLEAESFSTTLSTIISKKASFANPVITERRSADLRQTYGTDFVNIKLDFNDGIIGDNLFLMKKADASVIANLMMNQGEDVRPAEFDDLYQSAFAEAVSQMNGAFITNLTNKYGRNIRVAPPKVGVVNAPNNLLLPDSENLVEVFFSCTIEGAQVNGFYQIMSMATARDFVSFAGGTVQPAAQMSFQRQAPAQGMSQGFPGAVGMGMPAQQPSIGIQRAEFPNLAQQAGLPPEQASNISLLLDVPMQLTVELGRTRMLIKDILGLGEGSIIELDKLAGEPVDILVNNKLVAKGEVVVIDENFGVRVTDIITPMERINTLQ
jgi:flagellar motor switch protein FliN